jgi:hypothetical protein
MAITDVKTFSLTRMSKLVSRPYINHAFLDLIVFLNLLKNRYSIARLEARLGISAIGAEETNITAKFVAKRYEASRAEFSSYTSFVNL